MDTDHAFEARLRQVFRLSTIQLDAADPNPPVWAAVMVGAGLGLVWGVTARIWMRLISTQPEFSIPGTTAILVIATVFGACTGFAFAARRRGWRRWGHYLPRSLVIALFLPFGIAGGMPLMLTVLLATLAVTHTAVIGLWVLAALVILVGVGTDIAIPAVITVITLAEAIALTAWKWITRRWQDKPGLIRVDTWLERIGRTILLLLAVVGFGTVAWGIVTAKPGWLAFVYVLFYIILLYSLFLALRVGLEPRDLAGSRDAPQTIPVR